MDSSSQNTHEDASSDLDEEEIPIPNNLRFTVDSLKLLIQTPLTQDNYLNWSTQVQSIFTANGYTKHLNPNTPTPPPFLTTQDGHHTKNPTYSKYNLINHTLMTALRATISPSLQSLVLRHETVAAIWSTLQSYLQSQTRSRLTQLKAELYNLKMRSTDLPTYLNHVRSIHDQLEAAGCHTDDEDMIILVMNGLPDQFDGFVSAFRLKSEQITLPTFFSLLTTEALNIQQRSKTHSPDPNLALATTHHRPPPTPYRNPNYKGKNPRPYYPPSTSPHPHHKPNNRNPPIECQLCKKPGHTATTCRFRYHPSTSSSSPSHPKTAYLSDHHTPSYPYPTPPPPYTPPPHTPDT